MISIIPKIAICVLEAIEYHRRTRFADPPGEILMSTPDVQHVADWTRENMEDKWRPPRKIYKDGDTGTLWGRPLRATDRMPVGKVAIGEWEITGGYLRRSGGL